MTSKCNGLSGWVFGHDFETYLKSTKPLIEKIHCKEIDSEGLAFLADKMSEKVYEIRCKRCGKIQ